MLSPPESGRHANMGFRNLGDSWPRPYLVILIENPGLERESSKKYKNLPILNRVSLLPKKQNQLSRIEDNEYMLRES